MDRFMLHDIMGNVREVLASYYSGGQKKKNNYP